MTVSTLIIRACRRGRGLEPDIRCVEESARGKLQRGGATSERKRINSTVEFAATLSLLAFP